LVCSFEYLQHPPADRRSVVFGFAMDLYVGLCMYVCMYFILKTHSHLTNYDIDNMF